MRRYAPFIIVASLTLRCSNSIEVAGNASEVQNAYVAGIILTPQGTPARQIEAVLIPRQWDPVMSDSYLRYRDTTDTNGFYEFASVAFGAYNLQTSKASDGTVSLMMGLDISSAEVIVDDDTLKPTGGIEIPIRHYVPYEEAYLYIAGTPIFKTFVFDSLNGPSSLSIDSLPQGGVPDIRLGLTNGLHLPVTLFRTPVVQAGQVTLLGDSIKYLSIQPVVQPVRIDAQVSEYAGTPIVLENLTGPVGHFWFAYDSVALYIGAEVYDEQIDSRITDRDSGVYMEEGIELIIDTDRMRGYYSDTNDYKFTLNPLNTQLDSRGIDKTGYFSVEWNAEWQSAVQHQPALPSFSGVKPGYSFEMQIPWKEMAIASPQPGDTLGFEFVLSDLTEERKRSFVAWSNSDGGHLNSPQGWGWMVFGE